MDDFTFSLVGLSCMIVFIILEIKNNAAEKIRYERRKKEYLNDLKKTGNPLRLEYFED